MMKKMAILSGQISSMVLMVLRKVIIANLDSSVKEGAESTCKDCSNSIRRLFTRQQLINNKSKYQYTHTSIISNSQQFIIISKLNQLIQSNHPDLYLLNYIIYSHNNKQMNRILFNIQRNFSQSIDYLRRPLSQADPDIHSIILAQKNRQFTGINLIASENYCSNACLSATGSVLNNKYAEGYPGARYYGGTQNVDKIQLLCQSRALKAFNLSESQWGVNVQALSGSPANMAVYTGLLNPYDRIMSLDLAHGGHLSHGFQTMGKKISATSKYFEVFPYRVNQETGIIDYQTLHKNALIYRPKVIICGASAYSRLLDYKRFREICDEIDAILLVDMAHPAGLISAGVIPSPFPYADVVTTTTHKTLRGTRGALIFYKVGSTKDKKGNEVKYDYKTKIDGAVFPGLQGGPHMHSIAGIAVALGEVITPQFKQYQQQVLNNAKAASNFLLSKDYKLVSGGTDNHLFVADMRSKNTDGGRVQAFMNEISLSINKNTVPGDKSALIPSGIRIGAPAMTTRGCKEQDFVEIMKFIDRAIQITVKINKKSKGTKLKDFKDALKLQLQNPELVALRKEINQFSSKFQVPGGNL